jgi:hypothetical protein
MAVDSVSHNVAPTITGAIRQASQSTGISFQYLLTTAKIESNFNPAAKASTSSAKGLYQFIDQTWLSTVKQSGAAHGLGQYADAIVQMPDGHYEVPDPGSRAAIMRLRDDPTVSAMMAGAFARSNAAQLAGALGRPATEGELYMAHFLGADGAAKLIGAAARAPQSNAAAMFPQAAAANRGIFFDNAGRARSAGDVYSILAGRFEAARTATVMPGLRGTIGIAAAGRAPDPAGTAQAYANAREAAPPVPDTRPLFEAMFTDRVGVPIDRTVRSLWTPAKASPADASAVKTSPAANAQGASAGPLDLFTDSVRAPRALFGGKS